MDIRNIIKSRKVRSRIMYGLSFLPDAVYVSLFYRAVTGKWPNLNNPRGYNEKLQWLKLHDKKGEYTILADKIAVREHVEKVLGSGYLFNQLGVWNSGDEIDFDTLPNEFVLKCNHDSGSVKLIKNKDALSKEELEKIRDYYNGRVKKNFFYAGREYPYKGINGRVFAEELMHSAIDDEGGINDFKFFCFDGEPKLMLMVTGRQTEKHEDYFDMTGKHMHIQNGWTESPVCPELPDCFEEMKEMAAKLSRGIKQVRIDLYEIDGRPYFGEYTFFSGGGFELFKPDKWERQLGDWIKL